VSNEVSTSGTESIKLGACGWNHAHWTRHFYPDDLPPDWRLSYYANEFSAVLLPENQWRENLLLLEEWAFDVGDDFRFYLQSKTPLVPAEQSRVQDILGDKLGAIVSITDNDQDVEIDTQTGVGVVNAASQDMRSWRKWLEQHGSALQAVFLNDDSLSYQQMRDFRSLLELMGL